MGLLSKLFGWTGSGTKTKASGTKTKASGTKTKASGTKPDSTSGAFLSARPSPCPVFDAWTSCNLERMLTVANEPCHPLDRHFLLMNIVAAGYKARKKDPHSRELCERFARRHLAEFPNFVRPLRNGAGGTLPRVSTFQHLPTLLTEAGEYDGAIEVCELALSYGLHDGTKGGFEGRITRIRKMAGK